MFEVVFKGERMRSTSVALKVLEPILIFSGYYHQRTTNQLVYVKNPGGLLEDVRYDESNHFSQQIQVDRTAIQNIHLALGERNAQPTSLVNVLTNIHRRRERPQGVDSEQNEVDGQHREIHQSVKGI